MPYRLKPGDSSVIQVKKKGIWHDKYHHDSANSAMKQLYVLKKKVKHNT